jgi:hypothetical protein
LGFSALFVSLIWVACSKDVNSPLPQPYDNNTSVSERGKGKDSFFLDGKPISEEAYNKADEKIIKHSIINNPGEEQSSEHYLFSTRELHEIWGDAKGFKTSAMNKVKERLQFVADSAGVFPTVETDNFVTPQWFQDYETTLTNAALSSNSILCYLSMRLSKQMCNPDIPPGGLFVCNGLNTTTGYPIVISLGVPALTLMNNSVSAWLPKRVPWCISSSYAHLEVFNKWGYQKFIRHITVNLNVPGSDSVLFVPFSNIYADCNDVMGSFRSWGTIYND